MTRWVSRSFRKYPGSRIQCCVKNSLFVFGKRRCEVASIRPNDAGVAPSSLKKRMLVLIGAKQIDHSGRNKGTGS
ncbi:hypothetical protein D3C78_1733250 [compost metagenome]